MHIVINKSQPKNSNKTYQSILLMESYRENGKVKKRTVANLSKCNPKEIEAIRLALKHKDDLSVLGSLKEELTLEEGKSVGAVYVAYEVAKRIGIEEAVGRDHNGKLAMWQMIARLIGQGSRLNAVRMAESHAVSEILGMQRGFDENDLYENLEWIAEQQEEIEERLKKLKIDRWANVEVDKAFWEFKTDLLEVRPVFMNTEKSIQGYVMVEMLAYLVSNTLREAWKGLNVTVEEGIRELSKLCSMKVKIRDQAPFRKVPQPRSQTRELLDSLGISMPTTVPHI